MLSHYESLISSDLKVYKENALGHKTKNDNNLTYECNDVDFVKEAIELRMSNTMQSCAFLSFLQIGPELISISTDVWYIVIMIFL